MIIFLIIWVLFGIGAFILDIIDLKRKKIYYKRFPFVYEICFIVDIPLGFASFLLNLITVLSYKK